MYIHQEEDLKLQLEVQNIIYQRLSPQERINKLFEQYPTKQILITSSFGTTTVYLLHLLSQTGLRPRVHFIDTTYHFEETIVYKNELQKRLDIEIIDVLPDADFNDMTTKSRLWEKNPDTCCLINKVQPLENLKANFEIWVSGLMHWQTLHRKELQIFEHKKGITKFYPILDVEQKIVNEYLKTHHLPLHPLQKQGFASIGCKHCTTIGEKREGRWKGSFKTECGLHT